MIQETWTNKISSELRGDKVIWAIMILLGMFSILAVYSATGSLAYKEANSGTETFLVRHGLILFIGFLMAYIVHLLHYMTFSRSAPILLLISIPLLFYTLLFGAEINDARRWISIPFLDLTFQSSDFAKLALLIYVARAISVKQDYIKDFNSAFVPIILPIVIVCGLIAPADLSTALLLFFTCLVMMFVGRVSTKYLVLLILVGVVVFAFLILIAQLFPDFVRVETWISRVNDFINNPDGGYQVRQSKIAIASGEIFGNGPGNSIQRNYLPTHQKVFEATSTHTSAAGSYPTSRGDVRGGILHAMAEATGRAAHAHLPGRAAPVAAAGLVRDRRALCADVPIITSAHTHTHTHRVRSRNASLD